MKNSLTAAEFKTYKNIIPGMIIAEFIATPCIFRLLACQRAGIIAERQILEVLDIQFADSIAELYTSEAMTSARDAFQESKRVHERTLAMFN